MFLRLLLKSVSSETVDIIYEANTLTFLRFLSVKDIARSVYIIVYGIGGVKI